MPRSIAQQQDTDPVALVQQLGTAIRHRIAEAMRRGQVCRKTRTIHVWKANYSEGGLNESYSQESREEWDWSTLQSLVTSARQEASLAFERAAQAIEKASTVDLPTARGHLEHFLLLAARATAEEGTASQLRRLTQRFLHEVRGGAITWKINVWLGGVSVESSLTIGAGLRLRPPKSDDFDREVRDYPPGLASSPSGSLFDLPDAILEVERRSAAQPSHEIRKIVNALCLFRLGSVRVLKAKEAPDSILIRPTESGPPGRASDRFSYRVFNADRRNLRAFVSRVARLLPVNPQGVHSDPISGGRTRGLKEYFRALHQASDAEERTMLAVAALEGILGRKEREKRRRLAQRVAVLLGFAGLCAFEVNRQVTEAYGVRSAFAHGDLSTVEGRSRAEATESTVLQYARLALLKHLEVDRWSSNKDTFLDDLDEVHRDPSKQQRLRKELSGGLWGIAGPSLGCDESP